MMSRSSNRFLPFAILTSLLLVSISFAALDRFSGASLIPCTEPRAGRLLISLVLALLVQLFFIRRVPPAQFTALLTGHLVFALLALWLGVYAVSPLGYSTGEISNLRGFLIIRANRSSIVETSEVVSLKHGSAVGINSLLLDTGSQCTWMSSTGAALDDPSSCDTVYVPPNADHDILRIRIRSSCGLPDSAGQIRVSILP